MKQAVIFVCIFVATLHSVAAQNQGNRYARNSILSEGGWTKISVSNSGIHRLDYSDLKSMGINPPEVRIFGYGGAMLPENFSLGYIDDLPEVAIYMNSGSDGVFNEGDYILFYAQASVDWALINSNKYFHHIRNPYSDLGYYFVTSSSAGYKRINMAQSEGSTFDNAITNFTDYALHENDLINLANGGREFYGEEFHAQKSNLTFSFEKSILPSKAQVRIHTASKNKSESSMSVEVNGKNIATTTLKSNGQSIYEVATPTVDTFSFVPSRANQITVKLNYNQANIASAYLNYFEINFKRELSIEANEFYFRDIENISKNKTEMFVLSNLRENTQIWDITNRQNVFEVPIQTIGNNRGIVVNTNLLRQFVAVDVAASFAKPKIEGYISNQNLHSLPQQDMIIISDAEFVSEAERLAEIHRRNDNLKVVVVDKEKIYNEFSSGTPDATAYRRFVKMFYDRGQSSLNQPKYLLLFGDGTYDNRGITKGSKPFNKILTYQNINSTNIIKAFVSDDYFAFLDDNEVTYYSHASADLSSKSDSSMTPSAGMDIAVGRMPVHTVEQAKTVVDKTISYMENKIRGEWKNRFLFVADDGDGNLHMRDADKAANILQNSNPDILLRKLYLDAYKQETSAAIESYPTVNSLLENYIKLGVMIINYIGHGSRSSWTNEQVLTSSKIIEMTNDKYPLFITATCDFSSFDHLVPSGGEQLLWNKTGGTMALITTTRTVFSGANSELNNYLSEKLFDTDADGNPLPIGTILMLSKNQQKTTLNKFAFALLGDPALKLTYPNRIKVVTDSIKNRPIDTQKADTLSALDFVMLSGHIQSNNGEIVRNFNGYVTISIFDKTETIRTLANDAGSSPYEYNYRINPIFRGSARVEKGRFKIEFMMPKDIKYNYGTGRIVYYATEDNFGMEANGSFEHFIIGGENTNPTPDNQGPEVSLFLNNRSFVECQKVNSSPLFIADIFDQSGINTVGNGIGHDIVLKQHKENTEEIVLNDYYLSKMGDYRSGTIEYQLNNLAEGKYNMWFRVWDIQNNSSTKEICFEVSNSIAISADVVAYPNPAVDFVTFAVDHDRPYKSLYVTARVFDVVGRQIWQSNKTAVTTGARTEITWNFAKDGMAVNSGLYLVQLELSTKGEKSRFKTIKLLIK